MGDNIKKTAEQSIPGAPVNAKTTKSSIPGAPVNAKTTKSSIPGKPVEERNWDSLNNRPYSRSEDSAIKNTLDTAPEKVSQNTRSDIDIASYHDYGVETAFNVNWDAARAENQGGLELTKNALFQVVGTGVGMTISGMGSLMSYDRTAQSYAEAESTFGNFLQGLGKTVTENVKDENPIYKTSTGVDFTDPGFYSEGVANVGGSALGMMIPTILGVGALTGLARITQLTKALTLAGEAAGMTEASLGIASQLTESITGGILSTHIEGSAESKDTYDKVYKELKNLTSDERAKQLAGVAASQVYKRNYATLLTNIGEYYLMASKFNAKNFAKSAEGAVPPHLKGYKGYLAAMGTESLEEGYQYINSDIAERFAKEAAGVTSIGEESTGKAVKRYLKDGEMWSSVLWGAAGGAMFHGGGPLVKKALNKIMGTEAKEKAATAKAKSNYWNNVISKADESDSEYVQRTVRSQWNQDKSLDSAEDGTINVHIDWLERFSKLTPEELAAENAKPENKNNQISGEHLPFVPELLNDAKRIKELYEKHAANNTPAIARALTQAEHNVESFTKRKAALKVEIAKEEADYLNNQGGALSITGVIIHDSLLSIATLEESIKNLKFNSKFSEEAKEEEIDKKIKELETKIEKHKAIITKAESVDRRTAEEKKTDEGIIKNIPKKKSIILKNSELLTLDERIKSNKETFDKLKDPEGKSEELHKNLNTRIAAAKDESDLDVILSEIKDLEDSGETIKPDIYTVIASKRNEIIKTSKAEADKEKAIQDAKDLADSKAAQALAAALQPIVVVPTVEDVEDVEDVEEAKPEEDLIAERLNSIVGTVVNFNDKYYLLSKEGVRYTLVNNTEIIEITKDELYSRYYREDSTLNATLTYDFTIVINGEGLFTINGFTHFGTFKNGVIAYLTTPTDRTTKITDPALLKAVNASINASIFNTIDVTVEELQRIVVKEPSGKTIEALIEQYWNSNVDSAIDKLYTERTLTAEEEANLRSFLESVQLTLIDLMGQYPNDKAYEASYETFDLMSEILNKNYVKLEQKPIEQAEVISSDTTASQEKTEEIEKPSFVPISSVTIQQVITEEVVITKEEVEEEPAPWDIAEQTGFEAAPVLAEAAPTTQAQIEQLKGDEAIITRLPDLMQIYFMSDNRKDGKPVKLKLETRMKAVAAFLENPKTNKVGMGVEYFIPEKSLNNAKEDLENKEVRIYFLDEKGNRIKVNGEELYGHLHKTGYIQMNKATGEVYFAPTDAQKQQNRELRSRVYEAAKNGKKITGVIENQNSGSISEVKGAVTPLRIIQPNGPLRLTIAAGDSGSLLESSGKPSKEHPTTVGSTGFCFLTVPTLTGINFPLKLNVSRPTQEHVTVIAALFKDLLNGKSDKDIVEGIEGISGLTYREALSFLIFEGPKTKLSALIIYRENGELKYGKDINNLTTITKENFESEIENFKSFIQLTSSLPIELGKINRSMLTGIKAPSITFMGKTYKKTDLYNDYLANEGILYSNAVPFKGRIFCSPKAFISMPGDVKSDLNPILPVGKVTPTQLPSTTTPSTTTPTTQSSTSVKVISEPYGVKEILDEVQENNKFIRLVNDTHYVDIRTGQKLQRVSNFKDQEDFKPEELNSAERSEEEKKAYKETKEEEERYKDNLWSASAIGNKVDALVRDFFDDALKELSSYDLGLPVADIENFLIPLQQLKDEMKARGEIVIAKDVVLYNSKIGIAGTVDLISYDKKGVVRIYDMKTMKGNQFTDSYLGDPDVKYDSVRYASKSNREKHQEQLSLYRILLNNTHGLVTSELHIIPIQVAYTKGDTTTVKLKLLPLVMLQPLEKVHTAIMKGKETEENLEDTGFQGSFGEYAQQEGLTGAEGFAEPSPWDTTEEKEEEDTIDIEDTGFSLVGSGETVELNADLESELAELARILPNTPVAVIKGLIEVRSKGLTAWGAFTNGMVILSNMAVRGTAYHEAFHAVFRTYITAEEREEILNEASKKYGIERGQSERSEAAYKLEAEQKNALQKLALKYNMSATGWIVNNGLNLAQINKELRTLNIGARAKLTNDGRSIYIIEGSRKLNPFAVYSLTKNNEGFYTTLSNDEQLEERLAEDYRVHHQSEGQVKSEEKTRNFFEKIYRMIKDLFTKKSQIDKLFNKIYKGDFANKMPLDNVTSKFTNASMYRRVEGLTAAQHKTFVDVLTFAVVQKTKALEFSDLTRVTVESLSKHYLLAVLNGHIVNAETAGNSIQVAMLQHAKKHITLLQKGVVENLKSFGIEATQDLEDYEEPTFDEEGKNTNALNLKSAFEVSSKDATTGNIKLLIAMLPKLKSKNILEGNKRDYSYDASTGLPTLASVDATWALLSSELCNIVDTTDLEINAFDKMCKRIQELSEIRPELGLLYDTLTNPKFSENSKVQFFNALSKNKHNFITARLSGKNGKFTLKVGKSDTTSAVELIREEWQELFLNDFTVMTETPNGYVKSINTERIATLQSEFNNLKASAKARSITEQQIKEEFAKLLFISGIPLSDKALNYFIEKQPGAAQFKLLNAISDFDMFFKNLGAITAKSSPIKNENIVLELAKIEALFRENLQEASVIGADNSTYYVYAAHNYLSKKIAELNVDNAYLERLAKATINTNSTWIPQMIQNMGMLKMHTFNNLRKENAQDTGDTYQSLPQPDELTMRMNAVLKGYFPMLTPADKPVWYFMSGPEVFRSNPRNVNTDGSFTYHKETVDIFTDHFMEELIRMRQAWEEVYGENKLDESELIRNYHTGEKNAFKSQLFPELAPYITDANGKTIENPNSPGIKDYNLYLISQEYKASWAKDTKEKLTPYIEKVLKQRVAEQIEEAITLGIISRNDKGELGNNSLDVEILKDLQGEKSTTSGIINFISDYTLNALKANIEMTKIFTGDPAFYKNMDDFFKRVPGSSAPGQDLMMLKDIERTYQMAILEDIKSSNWFDHYVEAFTAAGMSQAEAEETLSSYKDLNETDAQGYCTMGRYKDLMRMLGKWTPETNKAYEELIKGNTTPKNIEMFLQPVKGVYFNLEEGPNNLAVPTYVKYSLFPLIPGVTTGTKLEALRLKMEEQGVHEAVFESGVKAGVIKTSNLNDVKSEEFRFNPKTLDNRHWKLQQEATNKYLKKEETQEGSQFKKTIISNLENDKTYGGILGKDLIEIINETESALSNLGAEALLEELGAEYDNEGNLTGLKDQKSIYDMLLKDFKAKGVNDNVIKALEDGLPLDAIPQFRKKIQQQLLSIVNTRTVKLKMPGGAFVQLSPTMFEAVGGLENSHIKWFNEGQRLLPPRMENGVFMPGQVLIPQTSIRKIKGWETMSNTELKEALAKAGLLKVVGYRIPTQGLSSLDALEIVGILPDYMGDTLISYPEITGKTGSDYDIDKMYIMMYNHEVKDGVVSKVPGEGESKEALQNRKLDAYYHILTSNEKFVEIVTPVDAGWLKQEAKTINSLKNRVKLIKGLNSFTGSNQMAVKVKFAGGKTGLGQYASQLVHHFISQVAGLELDGQKVSDIKDENGNIIGQSISSYMNGHVDIAKDPYVADLNCNTFTNGVIILMTRQGIPRKFITRFISQPIIEDLAQENFSSKGRVYKKSKIKVTRVIHGQVIPGVKWAKPVDKVRLKYKGAQEVIDRDFTIAELEEELQNPTAEGQLIILDKFLALQDSAKHLAAAVKANKQDTEGSGKTLIEAKIITNRIKAVIDSGRFENFEKLYEGTALGAYLQNSLTLTPTLFSDVFLGTTENFNNISEAIAYELNKGPLVDEDLATEIEDAAYSYVLSNFEMFKNASIQELLTSKTAMANLVEAAKFNVNSTLKDNPLVVALRIGKADDKGHRFISIPVSKKRGKQAQDKLTEAWEELLNSENPKTAEFGKNLALYAFVTSGFKSGKGSFFDLIPSDLLKDNRIEEYINKSMLHLNSLDGGEYLSRFKDQFYRNNWKNSKVVKALVNEDVIQVANSKGVPMNKNKAFGYKPEEGKRVEPFHTLEYANLFKFSGFKFVQGEKIPLYTRTYSLGDTTGTSNIYEYGEKLNNESAIPSNNRALDFKPTFVDEAVSFEGLNEIQFQKDSEEDLQSQEELDKVLGILEGSFGAEVIFDDTTIEIASVKNVNGKPVITINPNLVRKDTVVHEYGHIYIDALGGLADPFVRLGVDQLKGSEIEAEVMKNYPELQGEALAKEVLATAIGREGAILNDNGKFKNWIIEFFEKIQKLFGIEPNVARVLARELLSNQIRKTATGSLSSYVQFQKSEDQQMDEDQLDLVTEMKEEIIFTLNQKLKVNARKITNEDAKKSYVASIEDLLETIEKAEGIEVILAFAIRAKKDTAAVRERMLKAEENNETSIQLLRDMKSYISSYDLLDDVLKNLRHYKDLSEEKKEELKISLREVKGVKDEIKQMYDEIVINELTKKLATTSTRISAEYREKYKSEFQAMNPQRKYKGSNAEYREERDQYVNALMATNNKQITKEEKQYCKKLLQLGDSDLDFVETYLLDSSAQNDQIIQLAVKTIERAEYTTNRAFQELYKPMFDKYQKFIADKKEILTNPEKVYKLMLEVDASGNKTGNYVSEYRIEAFKKAQEVMQAMLKNVEDDTERKNIAKAWYKENTVGKDKPSSKWLNPQFDALKNDKEAYEFYKLLMEINEKADSFLPSNFKLGTALPSIRKKSVERLASLGVIESIKKGWKSTFKRQEGDTEFGETEANPTMGSLAFQETFTKIFTDEAGREQRFVPIYFRGKIENEDRSYDLMGLAMSNLYMSLNFANKTAVAGELEALNEVIEERSVIQRSGRDIKRVDGKTKPHTSKYKGSTSKSLNFLLQHRLYGVDMVDGGSIFGINVNKGAKVLTTWTAHLLVGLNPSSAAVNYIQGKLQTMIESAAGVHFTHKDVLAARLKYDKDAKALIQDLGADEKRKTSKTSLLLERFDVMGDYDGLVNHMLSDNAAKRLLLGGPLHYLNGAAEHMIQGTLMYSMLNNIKCMNAKGEYLTKTGTTTKREEAMSLDEAYYVRDGKLEIDSRVVKTTKNQTSTAFTADNEFEISRVIKDVNADLNGNYRSKNKAMFQAYAVGQLAKSMRGWLIRAGYRYFRGITTATVSKEQLARHERTYSESSQEFKEGLYTTVVRFFAAVKRDWKKDKLNSFAKNYDKMSDLERSNTKRVAVATTSLTVCFILAGLAEASGEDEEDEAEKQYKFFMAYLARRSYSELSYFCNARELMKVIDTPFLPAKTVLKALDAVQQVFSPTDVYEAGDNIDKNKLLNKVKSVLPAVNAIDKTYDYEKSYNYLKKPSIF